MNGFSFSFVQNCDPCQVEVCVGNSYISLFLSFLSQLVNDNRKYTYRIIAATDFYQCKGGAHQEQHTGNFQTPVYLDLMNSLKLIPIFQPSIDFQISSILLAYWQKKMHRVSWISRG